MKTVEIWQCVDDIISFVSWCRLVLSRLVCGGLAGEECKCAIHALTFGVNVPQSRTIKAHTKHDSFLQSASIIRTELSSTLSTVRSAYFWRRDSGFISWDILLRLYQSSNWVPVSRFLAAIAALYLRILRTEWLTVWSNQRDRRGNARIWSGNLQDGQDNQDTGQTGQTSQRWETEQTDLIFKLDFPGNLCRAAWRGLTLDKTLGPWVLTAQSLLIFTVRSRWLSTQHPHLLVWSDRHWAIECK